MSYFKYWGVNNLSRCAMSQKFPVNDFIWFEDVSEFDESFIKSYNEEGGEGYFFEVDIQCLENYHHNDLTFLPERIKFEKIKKLLANLHDKTKYVILRRNLKQILNQGL